MPLHDTTALIIVATTASESLPDPTAVAGRVHDLVNADGPACVWGSTGAAPFQVDAVPLATLTVPAGGSARVRSDGTRWVLVRPLGSRPSFSGTATTNASGEAVFSFPAGLFPAAPVVEASVQFADSGNPIDFRVTALSATSCTVKCRQSPTLVVLSLSVLGVSQPLAGVTVHLAATPAGTAS